MEFCDRRVVGEQSHPLLMRKNTKRQLKTSKPCMRYKNHRGPCMIHPNQALWYKSKATGEYQMMLVFYPDNKYA